MNKELQYVLTCLGSLEAELPKNDNCCGLDAQLFVAYTRGWLKTLKKNVSKSKSEKEWANLTVKETSENEKVPKETS